MAKGMRPLDVDGAETIAIAALAFLAQDGARLGRFLALTGLGPDELRENARQHVMLAAVLNHLLGDESLLLVFSSETGVVPEAIEPAHRLLASSGGSQS